MAHAGTITRYTDISTCNITVDRIKRGIWNCAPSQECVCRGLLHLSPALCLHVTSDVSTSGFSLRMRTASIFVSDIKQCVAIADILRECSSAFVRQDSDGLPHWFITVEAAQGSQCVPAPLSPQPDPLLLSRWFQSDWVVNGFWCQSAGSTSLATRSAFVNPVLPVHLP